jgi:hypothetical protein
MTGFRMADTALRQLARRCFPKEQHDTKGKADAHIRALVRLDKDRKEVGNLRSYQCRHCAKWHVGHVAPVGV